MTEPKFTEINLSLIININIEIVNAEKWMFKENVKHFLSILALLRGPIVWPSRARLGLRAAN